MADNHRVDGRGYQSDFIGEGRAGFDREFCLSFMQKAGRRLPVEVGVSVTPSHGPRGVMSDLLCRETVITVRLTKVPIRGNCDEIGY